MRSTVPTFLAASVVIVWLAVFSLYLSGCASIPAVKAVCIPVKVYTAAEEKKLAAELQALSADAMLARVAIDYGQMRDAARACARP